MLCEEQCHDGAVGDDQFVTGRLGHDSACIGRMETLCMAIAALSMPSTMSSGRSKNARMAASNCALEPNRWSLVL